MKVGVNLFTKSFVTLKGNTTKFILIFWCFALRNIDMFVSVAGYEDGRWVSHKSSSNY